jgi:hypothetical protein
VHKEKEKTSAMFNLAHPKMSRLSVSWSINGWQSTMHSYSVPRGMGAEAPPARSTTSNTPSQTGMVVSMDVADPDALQAPNDLI